MTAPKTTLLKIVHAGCIYTAEAESASFGGAVIINKLKIGFARYWLLIAAGNWRLVADMPLCPALKQKLAAGIYAWHNLPQGTESTVTADEDGTGAALIKIIQGLKGTGF